jgi:hypothetical protein
MPKTIDLPYPPYWINQYIYEKLSEYDDIGMSSTSQLNPIFATSPTNIDEVYRDVIQATAVSEPLVIIYDKMITFRPTKFYPHKREQLIYFLYSTSLANVNNANIVISQILDREDAAAQDINQWAIEKQKGPNPLPMSHNVMFHNVKVYQAQESRDLLDLASARTMFINKLIIEYDYHAKNDSTYK